MALDAGLMQGIGGGMGQQSEKVGRRRHQADLQGVLVKRFHRQRLRGLGRGQHFGGVFDRQQSAW